VAVVAALLVATLVAALLVAMPLFLALFPLLGTNGGRVAGDTCVESILLNIGTVVPGDMRLLSVSALNAIHYSHPPRKHECDCHLTRTRVYNHEHVWIILGARLAQQHVLARYPAGRGGGAFWSVTQRRNWVCSWRLSDWMNEWIYAIREPQTREQNEYKLPEAVQEVRRWNHDVKRDFQFLGDYLERLGSGEALGSRSRRGRSESSAPNVVNRSSQLI
jgi:hypothetical protein